MYLIGLIAVFLRLFVKLSHGVLGVYTQTRGERHGPGSDPVSRQGVSMPEFIVQYGSEARRQAALARVRRPVG